VRSSSTYSDLALMLMASHLPMRHGLGLPNLLWMLSKIACAVSRPTPRASLRWRCRSFK